MRRAWRRRRGINGYFVVAKGVVSERLDNGAEGYFVGRVAGIVGPARGTDSVEAVKEACFRRK